MSVLATVNPTATDLNELKNRLKETWMTGNYDRFSRYMESDAKRFYDRLGVAPGTRLLDVACGAGQLALIAARAGALVTGCDIAKNWVECARARAAVEGLNATFEEADAEALPYRSDEFDVVVSLIGAMFAPHPQLVAREMARVCRPGGRVAMANWTPGGFVGRMFKIIASHIAPLGVPSPALWGDEATVRERLNKGIADIQCEKHLYRFEYPFPPEEVVEFFRVNYGPMTQAFASLDAAGQRKLRDHLVQLWTSNNRAEENTTLVDAEYLQVIATRDERTLDAPQSAFVPGRQRQVSQRASALADRIEQGAAELAAFAETLTDAEWRKPLTEGGTDVRPVGVIVHHVASMYAPEVDVARAIAGGNAVTDITWEVVAGINAQHAREQAEVSKAEALRHLRRCSREAAARVRVFPDAELDQAAPFSLSFGAPMTAQFVIEDHALRHSWHHLARLRRALGK